MTVTVLAVSVGKAEPVEVPVVSGPDIVSVGVREMEPLSVEVSVRVSVFVWKAVTVSVLDFATPEIVLVDVLLFECLEIVIVGECDSVQVCVLE